MDTVVHKSKSVTLRMPSTWVMNHANPTDEYDLRHTSVCAVAALVARVCVRCTIVRVHFWGLFIVLCIRQRRDCWDGVGAVCSNQHALQTCTNYNSLSLSLSLLICLSLFIYLSVFLSFPLSRAHLRYCFSGLLHGSRCVSIFTLNSREDISQYFFNF